MWSHDFSSGVQWEVDFAEMRDSGKPGEAVQVLNNANAFRITCSAPVSLESLFDTVLYEAVLKNITLVVFN